MTSGEPPAGPSAAKLGGIALIGVGALAAVFGVATAMSGGPESAAQPPPAPVPVPPASSALPPQPMPVQPEVPSQPTPVPAQLPSPASQPSPGGADQGSPKIVVRVYNNSTIKGLANRAADEFRQAGYDVPEVGNYAGGTIYTTTIYFRPGTEEEAQARDVAAHFGARVEPRFEGIQQSSPGVIAIITNDYKGIQGK